MKALVYHGPAEKSWETVSDPVIQSPTDAIVRIDSATICGTDLHILKATSPRSRQAHPRPRGGGDHSRDRTRFHHLHHG